MADESNVPDKPLASAVLSRLKQFSAMNKLKKMACRVISCSFVFGIGRLQQCNHVSVIQVIAEKLSEEEIGGLKELFKKIDADKSGTITCDELKQSLKRVDSKLLESEIENLMTAVSIKVLSLSHQLASLVFYSDLKCISLQADVDENGILDYSEFVAATLHLHKLDKEENLVQAFSYFDRDKSGNITLDELQQACKDFGMSQLHLEEMIKEIDQNNVSC